MRSILILATAMAALFACCIEGGDALKCHCEGLPPLPGICDKGQCNVELAKACAKATHKETGKVYKFCDLNPLGDEGCQEETVPPGMPPPAGKYQYCRCKTDMCNGAGLNIATTTMTILSAIIVAIIGASKGF